MRRVWLMVFCLTFSFCAVTQDTSKAKISGASLTTEEIAVYRAVLKDYTRESDGSLNLANRTQPLDGSRPMFDEACFKEIDASHTNDSAPVSHRFETSQLLNMHIVLVDPGSQRKLIDENDPQNLVKKAVDDHERVTDEQVGQSVKHAFETGMFTLSEIVFDKQHRRAAAAYSFECGSLCGNGSTLILTKSGQSWKVTKRCGDWVS